MNKVLATAMVVALVVLGAGAGMLYASSNRDAAPGPVDIGFAQNMSVHHHLQAASRWRSTTRNERARA